MSWRTQNLSIYDSFPTLFYRCCKLTSSLTTNFSLIINIFVNFNQCKYILPDPINFLILGWTNCRQINDIVRHMYFGDHSAVTTKGVIVAQHTSVFCKLFKGQRTLNVLRNWGVFTRKFDHYAQFSVTLQIVPLCQKLSSGKAIMLVWCWLKFRPRIHGTTQKFNNFWYFSFTLKCNEKQRGISKMCTSCKYMYFRSAIWSVFISCCSNIVALMNIQYSLEAEGLANVQTS